MRLPPAGHDECNAAIALSRAPWSPACGFRQPRETDNRRAAGSYCGKHQRLARTALGKQPEHQRHQRRAHGLPEQPRRRLHAARRAGARSRGADVMIARLFGVLKKPNPMPHTPCARRCRTSPDATATPRSSAKARQPSPPARSRPAGPPDSDPPAARRTARSPPRPAARASSAGPVSTWLRPSVFSNKNGSDTSAITCAMNEQIEVATDSANIGMRSRSTGSSGAVRVSLPRHQHEAEHRRRSTVRRR